MAALQAAEKQIANIFKGMPPMSHKAKEALVNAWPWIAGIFGVLQLLAALALWRATQVVNQFSEFTNSLSTFYAGQPLGPSSGERTIMYLGVIFLAVDAVILLMAFPHLRNRSRRGWDLLFLGALLNLAYSVISLFMYNGSMGSLVSGLIGSAIGFYLLFQVRDSYKTR